MKKSVAFLILFALLGGGAVAQSSGDSAARLEELRRLNSAVEELIAAQALQQRRMDDLTLQIEKIRSDMTRSEALDKYATRDQLAEVVRQLKEVDERRYADREKILEAIKRIEKAASTPAPRAAPAVTGGFEYEIQPGDSFSAIAAGVSKQLGATVTVEMLEKANPGVDPRRLQVGKKIIIPEPKK